MLPQDVEQCERLQPPWVIALELLEAAARAVVGGAKEIRRRLAHERELGATHFVETNMSGAVGKRSELAAVEPAVLGQSFQADQQRVSSEGRGRRIGRVAVAGRIQ